jgi:hypothetical protein
MTRVGSHRYSKKKIFKVRFNIRIPSVSGSPSAHFVVFRLKILCTLHMCTPRLSGESDHNLIARLFGEENELCFPLMTQVLPPFCDVFPLHKGKVHTRGVEV